MQSLSKILCYLDDAVWSYDLIEQRFIYTNDRLAELYETSLSHLQETSEFWLKYIHPEDVEMVRMETEAAFAGKHIDIEYRLLINGRTKWVQDRKVIIFSENQKPEAITAILTDITFKKSTELSFSDSEKTFRYLFINNPNPLWIYDLKTLEFLAINNAAIVKYGYTEREFLSMRIVDIRPQEDVLPLLEGVKRVRSRYQNSGKPWRHIKKNGEVIYVDISGHGIQFKGRDAELVMAHDITREVESHRKIALSKKNLDALINNINEEIWSIDANYNIISYNIPFAESVRNLTGREVTLGESIFLPELPVKITREWRKYYGRALKGEEFSFISNITPNKEKSIYIETKMNPIRDQSEIIGVACISRNIQERLEGQKKIVERNKRLLELISIASHELRGPVASLLGLSQVFNRRNYSDPFNAEIMEHIESLTGQLDSVIHRLIDKTYSLQQENEPKYYAQQNLSESESL